MILLAVVLAGCSDKEADTADAICLDAPTVTWASHGEALMTQWCQPCHASDAANRHGAPDAITFDTEEQTLALSGLILSVATGDAPTMPPSIDLPEEDVYWLEIWLRCAAE